MSAKKKPVVIVVEGGIVQNVMGCEYVLVDWDELEATYETYEEREAEARRLCEDEGGYDFETGEYLPERVDPNEKVLACPLCKSTNIGVPAYIDPNTEELVDWDENNDSRVCYECDEMNGGEHFELIPRCETLEWQEEHATK